MTTAEDFEGVAGAAGLAPWRRVEAALAEAVRAGRIKGGERLPTEPELARRFGVNRHTVRRAIAALAGRGLVRAEQGRGTFVTDVLVDYPLGPRTRFSAALLGQGREPAHRLIDVVSLAAAPEVAAALGLSAGARVVRTRAVGTADGRPISVGTGFLPEARFPDLAGRLDLLGASMTAVFESYGLADYRRRSTRVLARRPEPEEARLLRQAPGAPVLVTEAVDVDPGGRPLRFGVTAFAGERVQIVVET